MAKFDLKFLDVQEDDIKISVFSNTLDELEIHISNNLDRQRETGYVGSTICLDISTAIKFAKTLRTEINKAKEGGEYAL